MVYCALAVAVVGALSSATEHPDEADFRERMLETELRLLEGARLLSDGAENIEAMAPAIDQAAALARETGAPDIVRERAAAIAVIYADTEKPAAERRAELEQLLPESPKRSALGRVVAAAGAGEEVSPELLASLDQTHASAWLLSRLRGHVEADGQQVTAASAHAGRERPWLFRAYAVMAFNFMAGLAGLLVLIALPAIWRRVKPTGLPAGDPTPWIADSWLTWYVLAAWFAATVTLQVVVGLLSGLVPGMGSESALLGLFVQLATGLFAVWFMTGFVADAQPRTPERLLDDLRIRLAPIGGRPRTAVVWGLGGFCAAMPLVFMVSQLQRSIPVQFEVITNPVIPDLVAGADPSSFWLLVASVAVLAPVFEECVFRGFLYRRLRVRLGVRASVLLSAFIFAGIHFSMATLLPLFALGIVLALITERSGSLVPAMIVHGAWNGSTIVGVVTLYGS